MKHGARADFLVAVDFPSKTGKSLRKTQLIPGNHAEFRQILTNYADSERGSRDKSASTAS